MLYLYFSMYQLGLYYKILSNQWGFFQFMYIVQMNAFSIKCSFYDTTKQVLTEKSYWTMLVK